MRRETLSSSSGEDAVADGRGAGASAAPYGLTSTGRRRKPDRWKNLLTSKIQVRRGQALHGLGCTPPPSPGGVKPSQAPGS